ncbi:hypothetical protein CBOM_05096 [Ceraceosorus bombacis]|uniref:Uncharacterized protein n=1 Tax=Ceraceosorus bombacis TaxID=401625 RepID=A0A0P1BJC9_9BASI|nr:hypothetical protein CBOM_05096 [Ceraceosorus bombacis]
MESAVILSETGGLRPSLLSPSTFLVSSNEGEVAFGMRSSLSAAATCALQAVLGLLLLAHHQIFAHSDNHTPEHDLDGKLKTTSTQLAAQVAELPLFKIDMKDYVAANPLLKAARNMYHENGWEYERLRGKQRSSKEVREHVVRPAPSTKSSNALSNPTGSTFYAKPGEELYDAVRENRIVGKVHTPNYIGIKGVYDASSEEATVRAFELGKPDRGFRGKEDEALGLSVKEWENWPIEQIPARVLNPLKDVANIFFYTIRAAHFFSSQHSQNKSATRSPSVLDQVLHPSYLPICASTRSLAQMSRALHLAASIYILVIAVLLGTRHAHAVQTPPAVPDTRVSKARPDAAAAAAAAATPFSSIWKRAPLLSSLAKKVLIKIQKASATTSRGGNLSCLGCGKTDFSDPGPSPPHRGSPVTEYSISSTSLSSYGYKTTEQDSMGDLKESVRAHKQAQKLKGSTLQSESSGFLVAAGPRPSKAASTRW